jgi:N-acetyl-alpha-D-glucosaminyl L-malate synthase BshA
MRNNKINILTITSTFPRWTGDTEPPFIFNIVKNLKKYNSNLKVVVLAPHYKGAKTEETLSGIKIYRFKYFIGRWEKLCYQGGIMANIKKNKFLYLLIPVFLFLQFLAIKKIIKKEKIDIIHIHWFFPQGLLVALYKRIFNKNIKIICTVHGGDIFNLQGKLFDLLKSYIFKNVDAITAVSNAIKKEILKYKINPAKINVIHNAIDTNIFNSNRSAKSILLKQKYNISSFCLLFVGRLVEKKGVIYLINAMPAILSMLLKTKLLIIGDGPELSRIKERVKKLKLQDNVLFAGKIGNNELPDYYKAADIFIGPSIIASDYDTEGFGIVFIEAMACGTPVIATNVGGITDIIKHNQTGILIPQKNPDAIADAVVDLLKNTKKREQLSLNGREYVKNNFNWEEQSLKYITIYKNLINRE